MGHRTSKEGLGLRITCAALLALELACGTATPKSETLDPLPQLKKSVPATSKAQRVSKPAQLPKISPMAEGRAGDFVLTNDKLAVVIRSLGMPNGGAIVDAAVKGRRDALGFLGVSVGQAPNRPPRYQRLHLDHETLRVWGVDSKEPDVVVETRYTLHKASNVLLISTLVTNEGTRTLRNYRIDDHLKWAAATPYAPGLGMLPRGKHRLAWLGAWSEETSYAYTAKGAPSFDFVIQPSQGRVALAAGDLEPQQTLSAHRQLIIGSGRRLSTVVEKLSQTRKLPTGRLNLQLVDQEGEPIAHGIVDLRQSDRPIYSLKAPRDGRISVQVPEGPYVLVAKSQGRRGKPERVDVKAASPASKRLNLGPPSQLVFDVRQGGSTTAPKKPSPLSCHVSVIGVDKTPTPWFGALHTLRAGHTVYSRSGKGVLPVAPGRYRVIIGRGPYYSRLDRVIELPPHSGASVVARLKPIVDTTNNVAVDFDHRGVVMKTNDLALANQVEGLTHSVSPRGLGPNVAVALVDNSRPVPAAEETKRWLNQLIAGKPLAAIALSRRRNLLPLTSGYPRTHLHLSPPSPDKELSDAKVQTAVKDGATIASNGPLLTVVMNERYFPGSVVPLSEASSTPTAKKKRKRKTRRRRPTSGTIRLALNVSAPPWMPLDTLEIFLNGKLWGKPLSLAENAETVRIEKEVRIPIHRDSFVVVVVKGKRNGHTWGYSAVAPYAASSPIWIDTDGNGIYDPPLQ